MVFSGVYRRGFVLTGCTLLFMSCSSGRSSTATPSLYCIPTVFIFWRKIDSNYFCLLLDIQFSYDPLNTFQALAAIPPLTSIRCRNRRRFSPPSAWKTLS